MRRLVAVAAVASVAVPALFAVVTSRPPPRALAAEPAPPPPNGCADGTREGFRDEQLWPAIAGCSGAWSKPGIAHAGALCSARFHLCRDSADVARSSASGCNGATRAGDPRMFFATAQSGPGYMHCASNGRNDLFGCGNLGAVPNADCGVLDRFSHDLCSALGPPWSCGIDGEHEADHVVKELPDGGGALCCAD